MDSLIFELQIVFYFQLFLSPNVRHRERARASAEREKEKHPTPLRWRSINPHSRSTANTFTHRRTGYFLPGGAVNHLPPKMFVSCPNFYKTVEQKRGTMQQHRPYWLMKMVPYSFSGSIPAKFEHKLRRHKQTFGKFATTVVLDKDENLL